MIYTSGLNKKTRHILVYQMNTPKDIIETYWIFNGTDIEEWVKHVEEILEQYAQKMDVPLKELSARPIQCLLYNGKHSI